MPVLMLAGLAARHSLSPVNTKPFSVHEPRFRPLTIPRLAGALLLAQPLPAAFK